MRELELLKTWGDNKVLIMKNHGLLTVGATAGGSFYEHVLCNWGMCGAVQATGSGLPLERATEEMWKLSQKQYDLFSPGLNEWPALLRRCDAKDPSYKSNDKN